MTSAPWNAEPLADRYAKAVSAVTAVWVSAVAPEGKGTGTTTYRITEVLKDFNNELKPGGLVVRDRSTKGTVNQQFLILSVGGLKRDWSPPIQASNALIKYIFEMPVDTHVSVRLPYELKFLEDPDGDVAEDAFAQVSRTAYQDLKAASKQLPREKLLKWITEKKVLISRRGQYATMLGICGTPADADLLGKEIFHPVAPEDFRLESSGLMQGLLLLKGEEGLEQLEEKMLKNEHETYSELYAVITALRFVWTNAPDRIPKQRLRASMRLLLRRVEITDMVIADLARWRDWDTQDRLFAMYGKEPFESPTIRRQIIRFMLLSQRDRPAGFKGTPLHVLRGAKYLEAIRKLDPKLVADTERFSLP